MRTDCLVIGYNDTPFSEHEQLARLKGEGSVEFRASRRDHVQFEGQALPYMDLLNVLDQRHRGRRAETFAYHIGEVPNLASVYLTNHLRRHNLSVEFVSATRPEQGRLAALLTSSPRVVAITTTFYLSPEPVIELVNVVRELSPSTIVVVGGPLIMNLASDLDTNAFTWVLEEMGADVYVHESEGEETLLQLVSAIKADGPLGRVPNLISVHDGRITRTARQPEGNHLDSCAIDWSRFAGEVGPILQTRTARSCAFKCSFCDYPIRAGGLMHASLETIERELDAMASLGTTDVVFIDDTFNVPLPRFIEICKLLIRKDYGFRWYSYFRCANVLGHDMFSIMADSGCTGVFLGIESADDGVLRAMNKSASADRYANGIEQLNRNGIMSFASFIAGFPGETEQSIDNTVSFLNKTQPTFYRIEPWWYNHRAPIHRYAERYGLEGRDYRWRHSSMDASGACDATEHVFNSVTGSLWMPMWNFDFWALPYLLGRGFTREEIIKFHELAFGLMQLNDRTDPTALGERPGRQRALEQWYATVNPIPARFVGCS